MSPVKSEKDEKAAEQTKVAETKPAEVNVSKSAAAEADEFLARPDARTEVERVEGAEYVRCSQCLNFAPQHPQRSDWVECPRCHAQPAMEGAL